MSFFKSQQIAKSRGFINRLREKANTARNLVGQLNALNFKMEALEDQGELFDTLMDLRDDREAARTKLHGITETEDNDLDHLVNYDNDNDIGDLVYELEVYLDDDKEEEDKNNHSNGNVVKRGITRLSKFCREYRKPDGIKLSVTFDALNRISGKHNALFLSFLGDLVREHIGLKILSWNKVGSKRYFDVDLTVRKLVKSAAAKMARSKSIYQHTMERGGEKIYEGPLRGVLWLKERVNKDEEFPDEIRSKEIEDKIKEGTLKVDHDSCISQLDNERREHQEKELEIQKLCNKMSQTEGMVTKLMNQLAAQGEQLKLMSTQLTPPDTDWLQDSFQRENDEFLRTIDENIKKIIKGQVKSQVKEQVSRILPRIEESVNAQLEAEVLTGSSHSSRTSYTVTAYLTEMELKKILMEKMEGNKSIQRSDEQRNLYKAFVDAYKADKTILESYGDTAILKRRREDDDDQEGPSAGSDRGSKRGKRSQGNLQHQIVIETRPCQLFKEALGLG
nr:hypothetical protein [Tanacetum cinerariifolium]